MRYIGIDIGGTKCAITLGNEQGEVLQKIYFETTTVSETINNIFRQLRNLVHVMQWVSAVVDH